MAGAKSKPAELPRKGVNTRITDDLRRLLDAAAAESGRSVGAEIERRLLASFASQPDPAEDRMRVIAREEIERQEAENRATMLRLAEAAPERTARYLREALKYPAVKVAMHGRSDVCGCGACAPGRLHWSDCAVHNEPYMPNGPCDCGIDP